MIAKPPTPALPDPQIAIEKAKREEAKRLTAEQEAYLAYFCKKDPLGVYNRYAALLGKLDGRLDGAWSFDSVDAAYISLDGLALSGIVSGLGRYFVETKPASQ